MTFEAERAAFEQRMANNWSTTDIWFDNVPYKPTSGTSYVRFSILPGESQQTTIGGSANIHRNVGILDISIFTPEQQGTKVGKQYADTIAAIFRDVTFSNITCRSPYITDNGISGGWYHLTLTVPYWRDDCL
jgi:hypothetical protein